MNITKIEVDDVDFEVDDVGLDAFVEHIDHVNEHNNYILIEASGTVLCRELSIPFTYEYEATSDNGGGGHSLNDDDENVKELTEEEYDEVINFLDEEYDHNHYMQEVY